MWGTVAGVIPRIAITMQSVMCRDTFFRNDLFQRREPVRIISLAGLGIAFALRAFDFGGERGRPFRPGENAALMQGQRHGEGLRFPRLAEHRPVGVARNARHFLRGAGAAAWSIMLAPDRAPRHQPIPIMSDQTSERPTIRGRPENARCRATADFRGAERVVVGKTWQPITRSMLPVRPRPPT